MLNDARIGRLRELLMAREFSAEELTNAVLDRVGALHEPLNCFITVTADLALAAARAVDEKIAAGKDPGPLAGIPFAVKDNICTAGVRTTCASRMLELFVPPFSALAYERLRRAGAVPVGKLNLDEFGLGTTNRNSRFGPTPHPWDDSRLAGGSSGAAAVAVVTRQVCLALGSDAGGSVRLPAAYCGAVGLKPTYGLVPTHGLVECAPSLEHLGPLTVDVAGCAAALTALAGADPADPLTTGAAGGDYTAHLRQGVRGLAVGVPREYLAADMDPEVRALFERCLARLSDLGARVEETSLPHTPHAVAAYFVISSAEAFSNLSNFDGVRFGHRAEARHLHEMYRRTRREGFSADLRRRQLFGTLVLSAGHFEEFFVKAQKVRTLVRQDFDAAFAKYDVLAAPTAPAPPPPWADAELDGLEARLQDAALAPANLAGLPALSLPMGFARRLPAGLHLVGPAFGEGVLLRAAHALEEDIGFYRHVPPIAFTDTEGY